MFDLYENIKRLCEMRGFTVSSMCDEIGISKSTLSNLKNGRTDRITTKTASKIASFFNVSVDDVMHPEIVVPASKTGGGLEEERAIWSEAWDKATPAQRQAALAVLMLSVQPDGYPDGSAPSGQ